MEAVIVADIISSTSFSAEQLVMLQEELKKFINDTKSYFEKRHSVFWGRVVRGDTLECYMDDPHYALRLALLLKLRMMLFNTAYNNTNVTVKQKHGIRNGVRVSIGVGSMRVCDFDNDILDGEAIYLAGRELDGQHTAGKEKVSIKRTLFYATSDYSISRVVSLMLECIDVLLRKMTDNQKVVVYNKLLGKKELEIAKSLGRTTATINQHSVTSGWNVISDIVNYYEKELFPL